MSAVLLDGKALSARMRERLGQEAAALPRQPGLAVILVGDNPASAVYVRNKEKDCAQCGVRCLNHHLPAETTQQELLALQLTDFTNRITLWQSLGGGMSSLK